MRLEAYTVGFDTKNYHAPIPENYSRDEILERRERNISENIIRYLGEYRLGVKYDEFYYSMKTDGGETYLESPHADPGPILNIYRRAIAYRRKGGLSVDRELAECLGFQKLQDRLADASVGTMALWVSPPGPKEDGYGTHSFTFIAQVVEDPKEGKRLRVVPYRNELSIEEHRDYLKYFDKDAQGYSKDTDFLVNPAIIGQSDTIQTPDDIVAFIGETEEFNIQWRTRIIPLIMPLIGGFIQMVRDRASDKDLIKAKHAVENRVLEEKDYILGTEKSPKIVFENKPNIIFERYGNVTPPVVGGSCGSSSTLMEFQKESGKNWEYSPGDCVVCGQKNTMIGPCKICKSCEKTFDEQDSLQLRAA